MDSQAERTLVALKEQLEALDYREPLGIESAPLVQRLLQDLILTTTNYEELRQRAEQAEQTRDLVQNQTFALRKEHGKVTKENNDVRALARGCRGYIALAQRLTVAGLHSFTSNSSSTPSGWIKSDQNGSHATTSVPVNLATCAFCANTRSRRSRSWCVALGSCPPATLP